MPASSIPHTWYVPPSILPHLEITESRYKTTSLPDGELLTVTATDPKETEHIRGLGFIGLLVSGSMHQPHLFAMARGEFDHEHFGHTH